ncbi:MAG TPA: hypothetical protein VEY10_03630 [Flavisolibacter sp.]|jgi:hypothetical protein|nr:hypothetical protein [Flavisolibacter sp.]
MKKYFTLRHTGWAIVLFEMVMCAVWFLSVFMVNGTDTIGADHLSLLLLVALTIASIRLMKARNPLFNKAVLWIAILPLMFIGYEAAATFMMPYEVQAFSSPANQLLFVLNSVR